MLPCSEGSLSAVVDKSKCFDAFVAVSGSTLKDKFLPECLQDAIQMVKGMTAMGRVVRGVKAPRYNMMKTPIIADRKAIFLLKRVVLTVLQN